MQFLYLHFSGVVWCRRSRLRVIVVLIRFCASLRFDTDILFGYVPSAVCYSRADGEATEESGGVTEEFGNFPFCVFSPEWVPRLSWSYAYRRV